MSTVPKQGPRSSGEAISWETVVEKIRSSGATGRIIRTENRKTIALRQGILSGAHFKIPGLLIAFESPELHIAQKFTEDGRPVWVNIGDDCIEVDIKGASVPSMMPGGSICFSVGDIDYKICPQ